MLMYAWSLIVPNHTVSTKLFYFFHYFPEDTIITDIHSILEQVSKVISLVT